ncbi:MAG: hypothetical protein Q8N96_06610 [Methylovulum sp.]|nr:hypothetical protein [Methylovulum sp.]
MTKSWLKIDYLPIPLIALMVLTRFHHFGDTLHLPDASLAVFFFAGFYRAGAFGNKALFIFLLVMAGLIDYLAIANGTSDWCISPAYVFLIPTYAVMWLAGRYCSTFKALTLPELAISISLVALATSAAFAISNGSFFLFSGRYEDLSFMAYALSVAQYFLPYISSVLIYALAGLVIIKAVKALPALQTKPRQQSSS